MNINNLALKKMSIIGRIVIVIAIMLIINVISKNNTKYYIHNSGKIEKIIGLQRSSLVDVNWYYYQGFVFTNNGNIAFFDKKEEEFYLCFLNPQTDSISRFNISSDIIAKKSSFIKSLCPLGLFVDEKNKILVFVNRNSEDEFNKCSIELIKYETNELLFEMNNDSHYDIAICGLDYENSTIFYTKKGEKGKSSIYYSYLSKDSKEYLIVEDVYEPCISPDCKKIAFIKDKMIYVQEIDNKKTYSLTQQTIKNNISTSLSFSSDNRYLVLNHEARRLSFVAPSNKNVVYRWDYNTNNVRWIYTNMRGSSNTFLYYVGE